MSNDGAEFKDVLSDIDVGQELVSIELNVVDLGAGVVFLEYLSNSKAVEFWRAIWGGGCLASRACCCIVRTISRGTCCSRFPSVLPLSTDQIDKQGIRVPRTFIGSNSAEYPKGPLANPANRSPLLIIASTCGTIVYRNKEESSSFCCCF
jgi:hypothetical protein